MKKIRKICVFLKIVANFVWGVVKSVMGINSVPTGLNILVVGLRVLQESYTGSCRGCCGNNVDFMESQKLY